MILLISRSRSPSPRAIAWCDTILDNLLENALNYTPAGQPIRLEWGRDHDQAYIAVLDRGPGLADGEAEHVFDRFYRGRSSQGAETASVPA